MSCSYNSHLTQANSAPHNLLSSRVSHQDMTLLLMTSSFLASPRHFTSLHLSTFLHECSHKCCFYIPLQPRTQFWTFWFRFTSITTHDTSPFISHNEHQLLFSFDTMALALVFFLLHFHFDDHSYSVVFFILGSFSLALPSITTCQHRRDGNMNEWKDGNTASSRGRLMYNNYSCANYFYDCCFSCLVIWIFRFISFYKLCTSSFYQVCRESRIGRGKEEHIKLTGQINECERTRWWIGWGDGTVLFIYLLFLMLSYSYSGDFHLCHLSIALLYLYVMLDS